MKIRVTTLLLAFALLFTFSVTKLSADKKGVRSYKEAITTDLMGLALKNINLNYEKQISKYNTYSISAYYNYAQNSWDIFKIGGKYRWYFPHLFNLRKRPIEGLSAGIGADIVYWIWAEAGSSESSETSFGISADVSYKIVLGNGWVIEPVIDIFIPINEPEGADTNPLFPCIRIGYAFK